MLLRKRVFITGIVQGVGFRPFVYRQANSLNLKGFVSNTSKGVEIEIEGESNILEQFIGNLQNKPPVLAKITHIGVEDIPVCHSLEFVIQSSRNRHEQSVLISPDISVCEECLKELFNPIDRRFRYSFINCTDCGPRYTIIQNIPYDRPYTTMRSFTMCDDCQREYENPSNRRFHAQPNGCPVCGPKIWLTDCNGHSLEVDDPIREASRKIKAGKIVAIKGIGGFHLTCDGMQEPAVVRLRQRKAREEKPLAIMVLDLTTAEKLVKITPKERDLLLSPRRPIVLLRKRISNPLAPSVAPRNGYLGIMLPYTPLHYLLLKEDFQGLVMTSGNRSEEPIATDNQEAIERLSGIADYFLMHNRDIFIRNDDSVVQVVGGESHSLRRSRGFVPIPVFLNNKIPPVLAVGGELKNTICITRGDEAFVSQHIGDLENMVTLQSFEETIGHLKKLLEIDPVVIAYDLHPDYLSTKWALLQQNVSLVGVQHHHGHIASCLAENGRNERVIGIALDGTGYGTDSTIWGGEVLLADLLNFERVGHFSYRPMPGGSKVITEPWRMAIGYLDSVFQKLNDVVVTADDFLHWIKDLPIAKLFDPDQIRTVLQMIRKGIHVPHTSSLGRLFDGVASITGLKTRVAFEGQAALELEMAMENIKKVSQLRSFYRFDIIDDNNNRMIFSPNRMIEMVRIDQLKGIPIAEISLKFHQGLVELFLEVCKRLRKQKKIDVVALSGGCFQNRYLLDKLTFELTQHGFQVLSQSQVPSNDGGLALGQAVIAAYNQLSHCK